jgi:hypothetical protein
VRELDPVLSRSSSIALESRRKLVDRSLSSSWEFINPGSPHKRFPVEEEDQTDMPAAAGGELERGICGHVVSLKRGRTHALKGVIFGVIGFFI